MEITAENNKLIAEFMGNVGRNALAHEFQSSMGLPKKYYHTSWDWLMPVVEKINKWGVKTEMSNKISTTNDKWVFFKITYYAERLQNGKHIIRAEGDNYIQATHKAVVEFIKWYNKQSK